MTDTQLLIADIGLDIFHLVIVLFLTFGWIWATTRPLHRIAVGVTSFLWIVVGAIVGKIGYCPVTDWHWQVKKLRGEDDLPVSYIDYQLQRMGIHLPTERADQIVMAAFAAIVVITVVLGVRDYRRQKAQA
ncbi:MAG TPA: DUF2784 family protein [Micavibrio sp.]|nr:DUF2784 family protein [Micavibrio sp.]